MSVFFGGVRANSCVPLKDQVKPGFGDGRPVDNFNHLRYNEARSQNRPGTQKFSANPVNVQRFLEKIDKCADVLEIPDGRRLAFKELILDFFENSDKLLQPKQPVMTGPDAAPAAMVLPRLTLATTEPTTTAPLKIEPHITPEQVAAIVARVLQKKDTTLGRVRSRYERQLREIVLPSGGFTTKTEADAAAALSTTLRDLRKVQRDLGLSLTEKPERVSEAERLRSAFVRSHAKTGEVISVRPRGRPRRAPDQASSSPPP